MKVNSILVLLITILVQGIFCQVDNLYRINQTEFGTIENLTMETTTAMGFFNWTQKPVEEWQSGVRRAPWRNHELYRSQYPETIDCVCEVHVNGEKHVTGEAAVCAMNNRIKCPRDVGCQKSVSITDKGFLSVLKSCGHQMFSNGCKTWRERTSNGDRVLVGRCICMTKLCNGNEMVKSSLRIIISIWIICLLFF